MWNPVEGIVKAILNRLVVIEIDNKTNEDLAELWVIVKKIVWLNSDHKPFKINISYNFVNKNSITQDING